MNRFVLLSAILHLGALAAWGMGTTRPPLPPAALTVTLSADDAASAPSPRRHAPRAHSSMPGAPSPGGNIARAPHPKSAKLAQQESRHGAASPQTPGRAETQDASVANNINALSTLALAAGTPFPAASAQPMEADASRETPASVRKADDAPPRTGKAELAAHLENALRDALAPHFAYPMMARRNGWQGQVQVGLRVEADGRLSRVRIAHSSGHRLLDGAALATLWRIAALPQAAGWLDGRHMDMVLPVEYRLIGGQN